VGETTSYFIEDHLGSTRALADTSGNMTTNLVYDSFGNVTSGSALTRYSYTGREADADTGLLYYRARWYDAQSGRFASEDPIGLAGGINGFAYVGNNPLKFNDPSGLCPQNTEPKQRNCNFPTFDGLSAAQQGLLKSVPGGGGAGFYNDLSQAQRASFLNLTGALGAAGIGTSGLGLSSVAQDRLLFAAGTTAGFQASIEAGISTRTFSRATPAASEHPGMSDFGARQRRTREALQVGIGSAGAFVDIDRGNPRRFPIGTVIHLGELITPGATDPFAVGRKLGSKVTGYTCK
jgi:RHS repeat-associated protein